MPTKKQGKGIALALTLALGLFGAAGKPGPIGILLLCLGIAACLLYSFSAWAAKSNLSVAEKIGRGIVLFVICCGFAALYGWQFWPSPLPAVTISPEQVAFSVSDIRENYLFTMRSNTDKDLYSVGLKFKLEKPHSFDDFSIVIPKSSQEPVFEASKILDIRGVKCTDKNENPLLLLSIQRLGARKIREISFTHNKSEAASLTAQVFYFSEEAKPRSGDPNVTRETFESPGESITCGAALMFTSEPLSDMTPPPASGLQEPFSRTYFARVADFTF